jgi:hypothetical protein
MSATGLFSAGFAGTSENANPDFPQASLRAGGRVPSPLRDRGRTEVVVIDGGVADIGALVAGADAGAQVFILDASKEGARQIADILADHDLRGLAAIHIVAHGDPGALRIGSTVLNGDNLNDAADALLAIGTTLAPEGEILLYGCAVGRGVAGRKFIAELSDLTGAVVAAATHVVGGASVANWDLDVSTGPVTAGIPFAAAALNEYRPTLTISGQLWYTILDVPGPNPGGTNPRRVGGFVNSDGTSFTPEGAFLNNSTVLTGFNIAVDTAAGLMFVANTDGLTVSVYNINTNTLIQTIQVGSPNGAGTFDDDIVSALAVDPINHVLFVNRWDTTTAATGIVKISYNPTAATNPLNLNGAYNSGAQQFLVTNASTGNNYTNATNFEIDIATHKLYYTDWDNNYNSPPFTPTNAIYVVNDYTLANPTVTKLTLPGQFANNSSTSFIGNIAVDDAKGLIYFTTLDYGDPGQGEIWWMSINGGTATKIMDLDNLNLGGVPSGLSLDPVTQQLYVSLAYYDPPAGGGYPNAPTANANKVLVYQLSADGHSFSNLVASYTLDQLEGQPSSNSPGVGGSHPGGSVWNQLPVLIVSGTGVHAGEQGGAITLANAFTSSDADGGYYSGATVQITGGKFSSNESSTVHDHLFVQDGGTQRISGIFTNTNITVSYNAATETLSLSGYDTIARYNTVMAALRYNTTGDNPTNYGANATRTLTWTVSDGSLNVTAGQGQNSGTTTITIDAVNDAPVNHLPGANPAGNEDATFAITGISVTDVDANPATQNIIVALSVLHGKLMIRTDVGGGVTAANVVGNGTNTITLTGTQNAINATLANATGLQYLGDANFNTSGTTETLTITSNDQGNVGSGGALQVQNSVGITVNAVNDSPVLLNAGPSVSATEQTAVLLDTNVAVSDVDLDPLSGGTGSYAGASLTIVRNGGANAQDSFGFNTAGASFTVSGGNLQSGGLTFATFTNSGGTLAITFTGSGTIATKLLVNDVIDHIAYTNTSDAPPVNVTLNYTFNDGSPGNGQGGGASATSTGSTVVNITAVNDTPILANVGPSVAANEQVAVLLDTDALISDVDLDPLNGGSGLYTGASLTIARNGGASAQDSFSFDTTAGATFTVSGGNLQSGGLTFATFTNTGGTLTITFTSSATAATKALVNNVIDHISYTNTSDTPPASVVLDYTFNDGNPANGQGTGASGTATAGTTVNITALNDAPVFTGLTDTPTFAEDGPAVLLDGNANATVTDPELAAAGNYNGAVLTLARSGGANASDVFSATGTLSFSAGNVLVGAATVGTFTNSGGALAITFNAGATGALVNSVLRQITYSNSSDTPPSSVQVHYTLNDGNAGTQGTGGAGLGSGDITVAVTAHNDSPVFSGLDNAAAFTEDGAAVVLDNNATVVDPELGAANSYSGAILTLARNGGANASDVFGTSGGSVSFSGANVLDGATVVGTFTNIGGTLAITFNASATGTFVNDVLQQITYSNADNVPPASVQINYTFNDGNAGAQGTGGAQSAAGSITVAITAHNDAPVFIGLTDTPAFVEDGAAVLLDANSNATVVDPELAAAGNYNGAVLTLARSGGAVAEDVFGTTGTLLFSGGNVVVGATTVGTFTNGSGTLAITFNANATGALVNSVLQQITYLNTSNTPPGTAQIHYTLDDGNSGTAQGAGAGIGSGDITVSITAHNDAPANSVPGAQSVATNSTLFFDTAHGNLITIADVDAGNGSVTVTLAVASGTLTLGSIPAGLSFTIGDGTADASMTFSGNLTDINAALNHLTYNSLGVGGDTLQITTNDNGNTGTGGNPDVLSSVAITIANPITLDLDGNNSSGAAGNDYNALFISSPVPVADTDTIATSANPITSATLTISGGFVLGGEDVLTFTPNAFTGDITASVFNTTSGVLTLSTTLGASPAEWDAALRAVTYNHVLATSTANRTIDVVVSDGASSSLVAHTTVYFHTLDLDGDDSNTVGTGFTTTFTENPAGSGPVTIADADVALTSATAITSATIAISGATYQASEDVLAFVNDGSTMGDIAIASNIGGVLILSSATATLVQWTAAIAAVTYSNTSESPNTTDRDITVVASDGSADTNITHTTIHVTSTNDAPVLAAASPTLTGINEDNANPLGQSVSSLINGGSDIGDADTGALKGIAISAATASSGHWEYSLNGGANWAAFPVVAIGAALLLRDTDFVRFVPDAQNGSSDSITFHAWDRTTGTAGSTADVSVSGGSTAFSATTNTANITVSDVNDAPVLAAASPTLTTISEDDNLIPPAGQTVASFIGATISDLDTGHSTGIAISATTGTNGHWEYSINAGASWTAFPVVSGTSVLLLDAANMVRFVPNGIDGASASLTYYAWDESDGIGIPGATMDPALSGLGGTGAFSTTTNTATLTVTSVNDAPTLTPAAPALAGISEDQTTNAGQSVAAFLGGSVTDVDPAAIQGIAIATTDDGNGYWEYSLNGGGSWSAVGTVGMAGALLLRVTDFIRFVPDAQNGTTGSITYYAWDQTGATAGQQGAKVDVNSRGFDTPFSPFSDTASITVSSVNDAPVLTPAPPILGGITEDDINNGGELVSAVLASSVADVDSLAAQGIAITGTTNGNGHWEYSQDGTTWTPFGAVSDASSLLLVASDHIRFVPDAQNGTSASFTYRAWDQTAGVSGGTADTTINGGTTPFSTAIDTASLSVSAVNDKPVLATDTGATVLEGGTVTVLQAALETTDVDNVPSGITYTVTSTVTHGTLFKSGGALAVNGTFTQADINNGLITYTHDGGETTSDSFGFSVDDGNQDNSPPSTGTFALTVTAVNDAPVLADVAPSAAWPPGSAPVPLSPGTLPSLLDITDVDSANLTGATVKLTNSTLLGDTLAVDLPMSGGVFTGTNISAVYNAGNFTLTLSGSDTLANYEFVLQHVTFTSTNLNPTSGGGSATRTVAWQLNDGSGANNLSNVVTSEIRLHTLDLDADDSVALGTSYATTFTEQGPAVLIAGDSAGDITINDVDLTGGQKITSATVTLTNAKAGDSLSVLGALAGGIAFAIDTSVVGQITLTLSGGSATGAASIADYQTALHQIQFASSSNNPDTEQRVISVVVRDSLNIDTNAAISTVDIIPVNDAPVVNAGAASLAYIENQAPTAIDPTLDLTDPDSANLVGATISITANFHSGQDILAFVNRNGITGSYNAIAGILTLSGTASVALYEAALQSVTYFNASDAPSNDVRTLGFTVDDGSAQNHASNVGTATVAVTPVNDAPLLNGVPAAASYANGPAVILAPGLTISDLDSSTLTSATVRVGAGAFAAHGDVLAVSLADLAGTNITASYNAATETLTLSGTDTLAHYSQALEHVTFQTTNFGLDRAQTIEWQVNDGAASNNLSALAITAISLPRPPTNDFNGNGHSDILWQNVDGTPAVWTVDGTNLVSGSNVGFNPGTDWHEIGSGDFNGDGKSDILWQHTDGTIAEWFMDGTSLISGGSVAFNPGSAWHAIGAGDFNGDGKSDILWQNADGTPAVWLMDGLNILSGANVGFNPGPAWHVIGAGDFDGDGKSDILWQNADGTPAIWLMDGTSLISGQNVGFNPGSNWHAIGAGDFDGNGKADILWQNNDGTPAVWLMDGASLVSGQNVGFNPGSNWRALNTGDFNADGKADILWQNTDGAPAVWLMDGTSLISGSNVGFNPGSNWHVIPHHDGLFG